MDGMSIFALVILIILLVAALAVWGVLAVMPGRIARSRNHSRADAVAVCGYWGAITLGLLMPIAFIWAYAESNEKQTSDAPETAQ